MTTVRCSYQVEAEGPTQVVLRDLALPGRKSLTNDVDNVVLRLLEEKRITPGRTRLLYFDSDGNLDVIEFNAKGFVRFAPFHREDGDA